MGGLGNVKAFKSTVQNRVYNADNQLTNSGFVYNGNGSPTTYSAKALTFDPEQRLSSYNGTAQTNGYDGDGLRVWQQAGSGTRTYFLYDGDQPVFEQTAGGSFLAANTYGADGLASRRTSSVGTRCYLFDKRGNVAERTDSTGAVTGSEVYDAYGARTGTAAQVDPFGYEAQAGYYTDLATGLVLCTHRFYDPQAGRFVTRDPIGYDGGINLYGYTTNNPGNRWDPSGLMGQGSKPGVPANAMPPGGPFYPGVPVHPAGVNIYINVEDAYDHRNWPAPLKEAWLFTLVNTYAEWDYKQDGKGLPYVYRIVPT